jgi:hypothetical protein
MDPTTNEEDPMRRLATAATGLGLLGPGLGLAASAWAQPAETAMTAAARCPRIISNTGARRPVTLVDHACATLRLGGGLVWSTPRASNGHVRVGRAAGTGAWYLTAASRGTATITSGGRPNCAAGRACPAFIVLFRLQVRVVAGAR